jgi:MerR family transcriptional regulator/heat shock protein HspR
MGKARSKASYMISSVAEQYAIHPQTLRLYEREGLLKPSRSDGNTRLYTDDDLERLEIILNMREKMSAMQTQIEDFVNTVNRELVARRRPPSRDEKQSLIPVITYSSGPAVPVRKGRNQGV